MNNRRVWSLLCAFVCAGLLMLAVGNQRGIGFASSISIYFRMNVRLMICLPFGPSAVNSIFKVLPSVMSVQMRVI